MATEQLINYGANVLRLSCMRDYSALQNVGTAWKNSTVGEHLPCIFMNGPRRF